MAPDGERHFEADCLRAIFSKRAGSALLVELVGGCCSFEIGRDISSHVKAYKYDLASYYDGPLTMMLLSIHIP